MHPAYVMIDEEVLRGLYVEEGLTAEKIAAQLGCAAITIFRRLRRFGIRVRPRGPAPRPMLGLKDVVWNLDLSYAVALLATDGNLSSDHRHMSFISKDRDLVETLRQCLRLTATARVTRSGTGRVYYRVQWSGRRLYDLLIAIGLTPAKSLTRRPLAVPDEFFADFFRGCIDGDGSVLVYTDRYHTPKKESYVYERLYVSLVSASRPFLEWIQGVIRRLIGISGAITGTTKQGRNTLWRLRYAKADSIRLVSWMYYSTTAPCLIRKRADAERFLSPLGYGSARPIGRPRVGWLYNVDAAVEGGRAGVEKCILAALTTPCPQGRAGSNP